MGRPRKSESVVEDIVAIVEGKREYELKACPKCDGPAKAPYLDIHGMYRCHCADPVCLFWDSQVYRTAEDAARGWNLAGGPDRTNW